MSLCSPGKAWLSCKTETTFIAKKKSIKRHWNTESSATPIFLRLVVGVHFQWLQWVTDLNRTGTTDNKRRNYVDKRRNYRISYCRHSPQLTDSCKRKSRKTWMTLPGCTVGPVTTSYNTCDPQYPPSFWYLWFPILWSSVPAELLHFYSAPLYNWQRSHQVFMVFLQFSSTSCGSGAKPHSFQAFGEWDQDLL